MRDDVGNSIFTRISWNKSKDNKRELYFCCAEGDNLDGRDYGDLFYKISSNRDMINEETFFIRAISISKTEYMIVLDKKTI